MPIRVKVVRNRFPQARRLIHKNLQARIEEAAEDLRKHLIRALENDLPLHSDTEALAKSLYVQTPGGSDYESALRAAEEAYLTGESRWRDLVQEFVTNEAYTVEHFQERVAQEEPLPDLGGKPRASVATMLAWGYWYQFGFNNVFTGNYEHRPWMDRAAAEWFVVGMAKHFKDLLDEGFKP